MAELQKEQPPTAGHSLRIVRYLPAKPETVFRLWTDRDHLAKWWGPKDFTMPWGEMDVREGGSYRICIRSKDGKEHVMRGVYLRVQPPTGLVFSFMWENGHDRQMQVTVTFDEVGDRTRMTFDHAPFETVEDRDNHRQGWSECFSRLERWITENEAPQDTRELVIVREIDAPRELVYDSWTTRSYANWWGPRGFRTTVHEMDVRVGGVWRSTMHGPDGTDYPNHAVYTVLEAPSRVGYRLGSRENDPHAFDADVRFEDLGGRTRVTMKLTLVSAEVRRMLIRTVGALEGGHDTLDRLSEFLSNEGVRA